MPCVSVSLERMCEKVYRNVRKIVFDIETRNMFQEVGRADPTLLDISLVGVYDSVTDSYSSYTEDELPKLWPLLEKADMLIGYNSDHFDLPLLNKYYPGNLLSIKSLDLLKEIKRASGKRFRLDAVAEGTLGVRKSGHGLQAIQWWKQGEIDKIRKYCLDDVRLTKELYDYARAHNALKYKDLRSVREIPIDASRWEDASGSSMTHTLPF